MAKGLLMLQPILQFFDNSGVPLNGGSLQFYSPSTTTPKNTYTDSTKATPNANPVILDSAGRPTSSGTPINIYLDGSYKIVVSDSASNTIRTVDPINTLGQLINTRSSAANDTIAVGDRDFILEADASGGSHTITVLAAATAGAGFRFGVQKIDSSANTVTIDFNASETGNGALTYVFTTQWDTLFFTCDGTQWIIEEHNKLQGLTVVNNVAIGGTLAVTGVTTLSNALNEKKGADVASATSTPIGAATGNYINVTGTTTITSFDTIQAGTRRIVNFTGALLLTYNATSLILPGAVNITTAAGDIATFVSLGSGNWVCVNYTKSVNLPIVNVVVQTFTSSGTYTPTAGMKYCIQECWGGGGGSGGVATATNVGASGGGGAGSYSLKRSTAAAIGTSQTVTIGAAGAAGASGNHAGGNGGDTSVGTICIGKGGTGSAGVNGSASGAGGAGGVAGTGDITTVGNGGTSGLGQNTNNTTGTGGIGGATSLGGVGVSLTVAGASGPAAAANSGSGACGALTAASAGDVAGGAGGSGFVKITEFI